MAFNFSNAGGTAFSSNMNPQPTGVQVQQGPDLEEIRTEALGFLAVAGERKLRLLPTPWPSGSLPPPTSSLLSVASKRGLIAAAGPDGLVLASTDSIRAAFAGQGSGSGDIIPFDPQLKLPMPMRISQVAFSADENFLVISAEEGGGLAVYDEQALQQGGSKPAFELSTNGVALRVLLPNPTPEKAELFAIVTINGDLMIANMKTRQFISGPNGQVLRQQVSCVSWSTRGKQLVAGLGNGACHQLTPEGEGKADIPRPPQITDDQHVSSISWLKDNTFLVVHAPTTFDPDSVPASTYHIVNRQPNSSSFTFQKLPEPCSPFGLNRSPPYHFIVRLKDFPPNLQDVLILSSTGSTDVGLVTRSKIPLTQEISAEKIVDVFTTVIADDSRRAQLPMTEDASDTSPIGMALDLSSKDKVSRPIPAEEIDQSPTPLPALLILNNDGLLIAWWVVYSDSIRQGTAYPGLFAVGGDQQTSSQLAPSSTVQPTPVSFDNSFGSPQASSNAVGVAPALANPAFGGSSGPQTVAPSGFGSASTLGARHSPWSTSSSAANAPGFGPTWGKPTFGSATPFGVANQGSAFGSTSAPGARTSPWGSPPSAANSSAGVAFGKPSEPGAKPGFPGASNTATSFSTSSGGFGSYANQGGFAQLAAPGAKQQSVLSKDNAASPFASAGGSMDTGFGLGGQKMTGANEVKGSSFGLGTGSFTLGSGFRGDGTAKDDLPRPTTQGGSTFFGSGFGSALETSKNALTAPAIQEADMDAGGEDRAPEQGSQQSAPAADVSATPTSTPAPSAQKPGAPAQPAVGGTFGTQSQSETTPAAVQQSKPATLPFGNFFKSNASETKSEPKESQKAPDNQSRGTVQAGAVPAEKPHLVKHPSAAEGTSVSVAPVSKIMVVEDAPLPPDPFSKKALPPLKDEGEKGIEEISLPGKESEEGDDWDDSGEEVTHDRSPTTDAGRSIGITPQSSFGDTHDRSPVGGTFTKISRPAETQKSRPLFGEIAGNSFPALPPPSKVQQSPSPVRSVAPKTLIRPESSRSLSSPGGVTKSLRLHAPPRPNKLRYEIGRESPPAEEKLGIWPDPHASSALDVEELGSSDEEDEAIRAELATEVQGSTNLSPLVVHQDYLGNVKKTGLAGQIERLYRDINSMIDTLGLNAKSIKSFVKGHSEQYKEQGRELEDLETDDGWCLIEVPELSRLENEIMDKLQEGKVQDVHGKIGTCQDLHKDVLKLRAKQNELRRIIIARTDPTQIAATRSAPLSSEQALRQHDIRSELANVQKLITEAEEGISVLKARIASVQSSTGKTGSQPTPTVEAVMNTIMKMTTMAEKRSGDVDVLEIQVRKLKIDSGNGNPPKELAPFTTPPSAKAYAARTPGSGTFGLFYTPDSSISTSRAMNSSIGASPSSRMGTPGSKLAITSTRDLESLRAKIAGKREVKSRLRNALERLGPRVHAMHD